MNEATGGRVFPSAAGFHTSQTFFTDDDGLYLMEMRDPSAFAERNSDGSLNLDEFVAYVPLGSSFGSGFLRSVLQTGIIPENTC